MTIKSISTIAAIAMSFMSGIALLSVTGTKADAGNVYNGGTQTRTGNVYNGGTGVPASQRNPEQREPETRRRPPGKRGEETRRPGRNVASGGTGPRRPYYPGR
jgi:hypothetical protein